MSYVIEIEGYFKARDESDEIRYIKPGYVMWGRDGAPSAFFAGKLCEAARFHTLGEADAAAFELALKCHDWMGKLSVRRSMVRLSKNIRLHWASFPVKR